MSIANYADLKASVAAWLNRTDLTAVIPDFITLAEAYLSRELKTREQMVAATLTTVAGVSAVALPDDFGAARRVTVQTSPKVVLRATTVQDVDAKYTLSVTGVPRAFAVAGSNLQLGPAPDAAYAIELLYYARLPALSEDADTNWLLSRHPDAYLYATLIQAAPYLGEDNRVGVWSTLLQAVTSSIEADNTLSEWSAGSASMPDLQAAP